MHPYALFVSAIGDIYIDSGNINNRVDVWQLNASSAVSNLSIGDQCRSLFIDTNNSLYCSLYNNHKVVKRSLNSYDMQMTTIAGTDCSGYQPHMLYQPSGIFVAINFDLYVADSNNFRVQLFRTGELNGTTVAGRDAPGTIQLKNPVAVTLDADGYLFIVDYNLFRIIGSGPYGFRCVVGCTGTSGTDPNKLFNPRTMAFDSNGNIFVVDSFNDRVQKFALSLDSCSKLNIYMLLSGLRLESWNMKFQSTESFDWKENVKCIQDSDLTYMLFYRCKHQHKYNSANKCSAK